MKGKATSKEEKSTKTKELLFALSTSNYIEFLQAVLSKHGLNNYEVTEKKHYPLKYVPPKAKGQRASDAIDVDNIIDYREMVNKLLEDKPSVVKVFVDMRHVEKLPRGSKSRNSEDDSEVTSDSNVGTPSRAKKADLDNRLARWRLKLLKAYKNEYDEGLTYIGPLGPIPLTPAMVRDWCLALEDGQATIAIPPNIESFNAANKAPALHPARKAAAQPAAPQPAAPAAADISSLTSVILLRTLAQLDSGLLNSSTPPFASVPSTSSPSTPQTPTQQRGDVPSSPPIPSPTQLARYLEYAETNLGVRYASSYKAALELHGIGPDILPDVDDKLLADLGISAGDVIRLKKGSTAWWNGPDVKRKRSHTSTSTLDGREPPPKRNNASASEAHESVSRAPRRVSYEKRYHTGGGFRFTAPAMQKDENDDGSPLDRDYDLVYFCETYKQWFPVPRGYRVDENAE